MGVAWHGGRGVGLGYSGWQMPEVSKSVAGRARCTQPTACMRQSAACNIGSHNS